MRQLRWIKLGVTWSDGRSHPNHSRRAVVAGSSVDIIGSPVSTLLQ